MYPSSRGIGKWKDSVKSIHIKRGIGQVGIFLPILFNIYAHQILQGALKG